MIILSVFIDYPSWFIFICILGGAIYATALYAKDRLNRHLSSGLRSILAIFRFAVVSVLAFFLLRPLIKTVNRIVEKPIVVIAQDNSSSLLLGGDTAFYRTGLSADLERLSEELSTDYEVRTYSFGSSINEGLGGVNFSEPATNFSALSDALFSNFSNRNLGAVLVASDGLYNRGSSPLYSMSRLKAPVYTIAMGDTTSRKDLLIKELRSNKLAYLGNRFPIEVQWEARELKGKTATLILSQGGTQLYKEEFSIASNFEQLTIPVILEARKAGLQRYTVQLLELEGEATFANNVKEVFIDVLDSRQQIVIIGSSPHPDIAAIRSALRSNENYEVEATNLENFSGNPADYSLVVFHQLPNGGPAGRDLVNRFIDAGIPALLIVGKGTDPASFNALSTGINLQSSKIGLTDISPSLNKKFSLFTIDEDFAESIRRWPPLSSPSPDVEFSPGVRSLLRQRIGIIETEKPLLSLFQSSDYKIGVILGEGLWRWRLADYEEHKNHDLFNEIFLKTTQYLAAKNDKSLFRVKGPEDILETDRILFEAELYNESYEPVVDSEVKLSIFDAAGQEYPFLFSSKNDSYRLDAGQLPVGEYRFSATVNRSGIEMRQSGEFVIKALQLEQTQSKADHALLYQLAANSGGQMFSPNQIDELKDALLQSNQLKSTAYEQDLLSDLINSKWILFLLIALLSAEWLLRKRSGTY